MGHSNDGVRSGGRVSPASAPDAVRRRGPSFLPENPRLVPQVPRSGDSVRPGAATPRTCSPRDHTSEEELVGLLRETPNRMLADDERLDADDDGASSHGSTASALQAVKRTCRSRQHNVIPRPMLEISESKTRTSPDGCRAEKSCTSKGLGTTSVRENKVQTIEVMKAFLGGTSRAGLSQLRDQNRDRSQVYASMAEGVDRASVPRSGFVRPD